MYPFQIPTIKIVPFHIPGFYDRPLILNSPFICYKMPIFAPLSYPGYHNLENDPFQVEPRHTSRPFRIARLEIRRTITTTTTGRLDSFIVRRTELVYARYVLRLRTRKIFTARSHIRINRTDLCCTRKMKPDSGDC